MIRLTVQRIAVAFALLMAFMIALRPLLPVDETRYLAVAWEMRLSGDVIHLTRNFASYSDKPPLLFWLINLVWLPGVAEQTARAIGPAAALLGLAATAALARQFWHGDRGTPVRAAAVLAGFITFAIYGSATMFDTLLTLAVIAGIAALWRIGTGRDEGRSWPGFALALAFGLYAKGPVILIHLLPPLLLFPLWAPAPPPLRAVAGRAALALLAAGGLFALWLLPALLTGDAGYKHDLLWTQSVSRVAGGLTHDRPVWFFIALLPVLLFPWGWTPGLWRAVPFVAARDPAVRLALIWAVVPLILFSVVASKQAHYLIPELPALAVIFGRILGPRAGVARVKAFAPWPVFALSLAIASVMWFSPAAISLPEPLLPGPVMAFALTMAGLALIAIFLPVLPGHLALGWGAAVALHILAAVTGLAWRYDAHILAGALAPAGGQGLAVTGMEYNAEVNFVLRLTEPVATPATPADLAGWARTHPGGLVFGPVEFAPIDAPPERNVIYRNRDYGVWSADVVALSVRE